MLPHDEGRAFVQKGVRLQRHMPRRHGSANAIPRNVFCSSANPVRALIQGIVTLEDQLPLPLDDLTIRSVIFNPEAQSASSQGSGRKIDGTILDFPKANQLRPKSVDSSLVSSVTSLNRGELERTVAGVTMSRLMDLQCRGTDLALGSGATWCIRNMNEQMLPETGLESSGEIDSGSTIILRSHDSTVEKLISKNLSNSTRNTSRACSYCGTSKTPLWRSGPMGPKSLCNACGIRLKKAGRRNAKIELQEVASAHNLSLKHSSKALKFACADRNDWHIIKKTRVSVYKKDITAEDDAASESKECCVESLQPRVIHKEARHEFPHLNAPFARFSEPRKPRRELGIMAHVAGRDEEEAATLLMALSYGCLASS